MASYQDNEALSTVPTDAGHLAVATTKGSDPNGPGADRPAPLVRHPDVLLGATPPVRGQPAGTPTPRSRPDQLNRVLIQLCVFFDSTFKQPPTESPAAGLFESTLQVF